MISISSLFHILSAIIYRDITTTTMSVKEPINIRELLEDGVVFSVHSEDVANEFQKETEDDQEYKENLLKFINMQVVGSDFKDEDSYVQGQPFEVISSKMLNITEKGEVKKRIIRDGYGDKPGDNMTVHIHYNAYIEYNAEPFDSTYARRNKPLQFKINCGEVILGLDIAVQSMRINEKSQFIFQPEFAYGRFGCLQRIPPNTEVLFEIELLHIIDVAATARFDNLSGEDQKKFTYVYDYCLALVAKAKELYSVNVNAAIREYNTAVAKLEMCYLDTYEDQIKQQNLLFKLYSNLLVAYTKIEEPKKGCMNFNKINEMVKGTDIKISAKIYYNSSRCLKMLGDFNMAKRRLNQAYRIESKNPEILNEMIALDQLIKESKEKEKQFAKASLSGTN